MVYDIGNTTLWIDNHSIPNSMLQHMQDALLSHGARQMVNAPPMHPMSMGLITTANDNNLQHITAPPKWFCIACPILLGFTVPFVINKALTAVRGGGGGLWW